MKRPREPYMHIKWKEANLKTLLFFFWPCYPPHGGTKFSDQAPQWKCQVLTAGMPGILKNLFPDMNGSYTDFCFVGIN